MFDCDYMVKNIPTGRNEIKLGAKIYVAEVGRTRAKCYRSVSGRMLSVTHALKYLETCPALPGYSDYIKRKHKYPIYPGQDKFPM